MAFVSALTLSHFRSHRKTELELDQRPIAILGMNGSGKTNILEAVSLLSPGKGLRRATAHQMMRQPENFGWKIAAQVRTKDTHTEIETRSDQGCARSIKISGKAANQTTLGDYLRVLWLIPSMDRLWIEGSEGRRRFLDRITLSFFAEHARNSLIYEKAMRERNRLLKEQIRDPAWYHALEKQMSSAGQSIMQARLAALEHIQNAQASKRNDFPHASLRLTNQEDHLLKTEDALADAFASSRNNDLLAGRTLLGPHRVDLESLYEDKSTPASECSTGEQKALLISIILANAQALRDTQGISPLILLDEVSAHLDKNRRAALYQSITELGLQAWLTGTEPELFSDLQEGAQYFEVSDHSGVSMVNYKNFQ